MSEAYAENWDGRFLDKVSLLLELLPGARTGQEC